MITLLAHIMFFWLGYLIGWGYIVFGIVAGWVASNLLHSLYIHRIYTHKHFEVSDRIHRLGLFFFCWLNLGSPMVYPGVHMNHHVYSGEKKDPHNPYGIGLARSLLSLWSDSFVPNRKVYAVTTRDANARRYHDIHLVLALLSAAITPYLVVMAFWLSKIVIVMVHIRGIGYGVNEKSDSSQNVWWMKPISWGEELHNNHHQYPGRADHNVKRNWREFDPLYYVGKWLSRF